MHRILAAFVAALPGFAASAQHHALGGDATRTSQSAGMRDVGPLSLTDTAWVFPASDPAVTGPIRWVADSGPVVAGNLVVAASRQDNAGTPARLWAVDRAAGTLAWSVDLPDQIFDSWSTPAIDRDNATALYAIGSPGTGPTGGGVLRAHRLTDGSLAWETQLVFDVVNASPLVTTDRGPADRAFITDYQGFYAGGDGASLYCINIDPFDAQVNPYHPGDLVWRAPLRAAASGATPAYDGDRVFVATPGDFSANGVVIAFDADAPDAMSAELWRRGVPVTAGFFGGLSVADGFVYAATYNPTGGLDSSRLVKIDAESGDLMWSTPSNRTDSIPIPLPDGRIVLSTGIAGFGSVPSLQLFQDQGNAATLIADTAIATWDDDGDQLLEPGEFQIFGGWTHQPHIVLDHPLADGPVALVGSIAEPAPGALFPGYARLSMIDLSVPFGSSGWVLSSNDNAGSSPAVVGRAVYSIGQPGLTAIGDYCPGDADLSGDADFFDLLAHLQDLDAAGSTADTTLDAQLSPADTALVIQRIEAGCE